jgi:hypothetical protein
LGPLFSTGLNIFKKYVGLQYLVFRKHVTEWFGETVTYIFSLKSVEKSSIVRMDTVLRM